MKLKQLLLSTILALTLTAITAGLSTGTAYAASHTAVHHVHNPPWYAPVKALPDQPVIVCIMHAESRSTYAHPNMGDNNNPYQYGVFQWTTVLWNRWSWAAGVGHQAPGYFNGTTALHAVTIAAYQSTLLQQSTVFAYVVRHDGTWPWTGNGSWGDGC